MAKYKTEVEAPPVPCMFFEVGDVVETPSGKVFRHYGRGKWAQENYVSFETSPGGGNRLLAGNLPADMAQLSNVVVADGALQSWTANGIDYVATYADGKVATVTASDGWVQTYTWAGDVPTITVARV